MIELKTAVWGKDSSHSTVRDCHTPHLLKTKKLQRVKTDLVPNLVSSHFPLSSLNLPSVFSPVSVCTLIRIIP